MVTRGASSGLVAGAATEAQHVVGDQLRVQLVAAVHEPLLELLNELGTNVPSLLSSLDHLLQLLALVGQRDRIPIVRAEPFGQLDGVRSSLALGAVGLQDLLQRRIVDS